MIVIVFVYLAIGLLLLVVMFVGLVLYIKSHTDSDFFDDTIVINLDSSDSNKRCVGYLKSNFNARNNRKIITALPRDCDPDMGVVDDEIVTVANFDRVITIPRGVLSKDKNIMFIMPERSEDMPEDLRNTNLGIALSIYCDLAMGKKVDIDAARELINRQALLKLENVGELSVDKIHSLNELSNDLAKIKDPPKQAPVAGTGYAGRI